MNSPLTEAALLREVARVQHDKTLQAVRGAVNSVPVTKPRPNRRFDDERVERTAKEFRADLVAALQQMREQP